jgi:hypothetical protein
MITVEKMEWCWVIKYYTVIYVSMSNIDEEW